MWNNLKEYMILKIVSLENLPHKNIVPEKTYLYINVRLIFFMNVV